MEPQSAIGVHLERRQRMDIESADGVCRPRRFQRTGRRGEMISVIGQQAWQDGRQQRIEDKTDSNTCAKISCFLNPL
jgi:hypothetical protein